MKEITISQIENSIYLIRGQRVMLDYDLAALYEVETKVLNRQVKRNIDRFPEDFMFQLNNQELTNLRCQIGTSSSHHGGIRYLPFAFTENGVAMLSGVLNSPQAIHVNISIMRIFTRLKSFLMIEQELKYEVKNLKADTGKMFQVVFERLDALDESTLEKESYKKRKIGLQE